MRKRGMPGLEMLRLSCVVGRRGSVALGRAAEQGNGAGVPIKKPNSCSISASNHFHSNAWPQVVLRTIAVTFTFDGRT